jgi:hypothetical protein
MARSSSLLLAEAKGRGDLKLLYWSKISPTLDDHCTVWDVTPKTGKLPNKKLLKNGSDYNLDFRPL